MKEEWRRSRPGGNELEDGKREMGGKERGEGR